MPKKPTLSLPAKMLGRAAAAKQCGVSPELIDYYANTGRLPYVINGNGHREYKQNDVRELQTQRENRAFRIRGVSDAVVA